MKLLAYWKSLNEREQGTLGFAGVFCVIYLFYLIIYSPLTSAVANKNQQLQDKRETLAWMQKIQQQYRQPGKALEKLDSSKLLSLIASELGKPAFSVFTYQMQQTGSGDIELSFEKIPYNAFITWFWEISHHYTIHIKELHIEQSETPGLVKLNLLIFP